jgi:hypothetical protein
MLDNGPRAPVSERNGEDECPAGNAVARPDHAQSLPRISLTLHPGCACFDQPPIVSCKPYQIGSASKCEGPLWQGSKQNDITGGRNASLSFGRTIKDAFTGCGPTVK